MWRSQKPQKRETPTSTLPFKTLMKSLRFENKKKPNTLSILKSYFLVHKNIGWVYLLHLREWDLLNDLIIESKPLLLREPLLHIGQVVSTTKGSLVHNHSSQLVVALRNHIENTSRCSAVEGTISKEPTYRGGVSIEL